MNPQTVANFIGCLGFILSLINIIHYFYTRQKKLSIEIISYFTSNKSPAHNFYISFQNESILPISITQLSFVVDNTIYTFDKYQNYTFGPESKTALLTSTTNRNLLYSSFPINVDALTSTNVYLRYDEQPELESVPKILDFQVITNRGKIALIQSECPEPVAPIDFYKKP